MANSKFNSIVGSGTLAKLFGKTQRTIQTYAADGILSVTGENKNLKFDLFVVVPEYLKFKEEEYRRSSAESEIINQEKRKAKAEADLKTHKAKMAKLELAEIEGEMHRSCDVQEMTSQLVMEIKNRLLALPGQLAIDLAKIEDPAQISSEIEKKINSILLDLSQFEYNPNEYKKRVRERAGWKEQSESEEESAAGGNTKTE